MNAGLFSAVRGSGLFSVDPDIGVGESCYISTSWDRLTPIEIDNPEALAKYYRLLLSIARVLTSVVLSRGAQNEQTIDSAKTFLTENRPLLVATFKRQAKIGGVSFDDAGIDIEELVELFMLLIVMTKFLDVGLPAFDGSGFNNLLTFHLVRRTTRYPKSAENRRIHLNLDP